MPQFIVTSPDGREYEITAPDGATKQQALEYARQQFQEHESSSESLSRVREEVKAERGSQEATELEKAGRGMMDVYQGGGQLLLNIASKINEVKKDMRDETKMAIGGLAGLVGAGMPGSFSVKAMDIVSDVIPDSMTEKYNKRLKAEIGMFEELNPGFSLSRLAGGIATPLTLIPGGSAQTVLGRVGLGSAFGGAFGALQPVTSEDDFFKEKGKQAGFGAAVGGALPIATKIGKVAIDWLDEIQKPLSNKGIYRDVKKFLRDNIIENKDKIVKAIKQSIEKGEKKTVGQIIAEANSNVADDFGGMLARLEKDISRHVDSLKSLYSRQSSARRKVLDGLSGTDDDLANAIATRKANAERLYNEKAFNAQIFPDKELEKIGNNKYFKQALKDAKDIASVEDINPEQNLTRFLHYVKEGLDKQLNATDAAGRTALGRSELRAAGKVKDNLVAWIENRNPAYKEARIQFQKDSVPINRMEVGREIRDSFITALNKDNPRAFSEALRNAPRTIRRAGGDSRFKSLNDIFGDDEISALHNIRKELITDAKASDMAGKSTSIMNKLSTEIVFELPHILSRPVVITNHVLRRLGVNKDPTYKKTLSDLLKNPDEFIKVYGGPSHSKRTQAAIDIARKLNTIAAAQETARETK